jgi:hypothetical protein
MRTQPRTWTQTCKCGCQVSVKPVYKLPKHYDDPTHPVSTLSPSQAAILELKFTWTDAQEKFNDEAQHEMCKTIARVTGNPISVIYEMAQAAGPNLCKKCNYSCREEKIYKGA